MNLRETLARLDGVRLCAGYYLARCPAHDDQNASLSIRESDKLLMKCFAGCDYAAIAAALDAMPCKRAFRGPNATLGPTRSEHERSEFARRIWRDCRPAAGTLVAVYLRTRGITLPVPPSLRFHGSLKHPSGIYAPAMVAAVQNREGKIVAVHRTWLRCDGSGKADLEPQKAALGPVRGCAVRLAPAGETLALAEGIETALSIQQATGIPTWAALGTSNVTRVELPNCVREVIICADADEPGEKAAHETAQRFLREGRQARIAKPHGAKDFNDLRL